MPARSNKATMHELKLRRLQEHNHRLREELARPRIPVSAAAGRCVSLGSAIGILEQIRGPEQTV